MNTTINGKDAESVIQQEVLKKIQEMNPNIRMEDYKTAEEVPGFLEFIKLPHYISLDRSDSKTYIEVRKKMARSERLHKGYTLDFRLDDDGHTSVAATFKGKPLWEVAISWDIIFETKPTAAKN